MEITWPRPLWPHSNNDTRKRQRHSSSFKSRKQHCMLFFKQIVCLCACPSNSFHWPEQQNLNVVCIFHLERNIAKLVMKWTKMERNHVNHCSEQTVNVGMWPTWKAMDQSEKRWINLLSITKILNLIFICWNWQKMLKCSDLNASTIDSKSDATECTPKCMNPGAKLQPRAKHLWWVIFKLQIWPHQQSCANQSDVCHGHKQNLCCCSNCNDCFCTLWTSGVSSIHLLWQNWATKSWTLHLNQCQIYFSRREPFFWMWITSWRKKTQTGSKRQWEACIIGNCDLCFWSLFHCATAKATGLLSCL